MRATSLLLPALLAELGAAKPGLGAHRLAIRNTTSSTDTASDELIVQTENFGVGCSPGGCLLNWRFSANAGYVSGAPAFNATCQTPNNAAQRFHCTDSATKSPDWPSEVYLNWSMPTYNVYGVKVIHEFKVWETKVVAVAQANISLDDPARHSTKIPVVALDYFDEDS